MDDDGDADRAESELRVTVPARPDLLAEVVALLSELSVDLYDFEVVHEPESLSVVLRLTVNPRHIERLREVLTSGGRSMV